MEQTTKNLWNSAAIAGLALGALSSVYLFISQFLAGSEMSGFIKTLLDLILWAAKFGGCIWLMMFFMKKFAAENQGVDNKGTRRFGVITALLSALVYAAVSFANVAYISADMFTEQMNMTIQQMSSMLDSNSLSQMNDMMEKLPQITFFSNLIYCFIFGAILSAILSRNIPSKDPFADYKPDEQ